MIIEIKPLVTLTFVTTDHAGNKRSTSVELECRGKVTATMPELVGADWAEELAEQVLRRQLLASLSLRGTQHIDIPLGIPLGPIVGGRVPRGAVLEMVKDEMRARAADPGAEEAAAGPAVDPKADAS